MYSTYKGSLCADYPDNRDQTEGIALNGEFLAGQTYELTYALRWFRRVECNSFNAQWILANGLENQFGPSFSCTVGGTTPVLPASETQIVKAYNFGDTPDDWIYYTVVFTPEEDYSQLWLRNETVLNSDCSPNSDRANNLLLDDLTLTNITPPPCDGIEASFVSFQDRNCAINLVNMSAPSDSNDCGDCNNPTGFVKVRWDVSKLYIGDPFSFVSPCLQSNDYNFSFVPEFGEHDGYQICLTVEDCNGCVARHCEVITRYSVCLKKDSSDSDEEDAINSSLREKEEANALEMEKNAYFIYPNPATDRVQIQINSEKTFEGSVQIHNLMGQLVKQIDKVSEGTSAINLSGIPKGIYIVSVVKSGRVDYSEKIMIE